MARAPLRRWRERGGRARQNSAAFPAGYLLVPHGEVLAEHRVQAAQMLNALIGLWTGRSRRQPSSIGWRGLLHKGHHVPLPRYRPEQ